MSPKLVYAMSDENEELKKQIGCMNGLLQFFDPHHFINNPRVSPGKILLSINNFSQVNSMLLSMK